MIVHTDIANGYQLPFTDPADGGTSYKNALQRAI